MLLQVHAANLSSIPHSHTCPNLLRLGLYRDAEGQFKSSLRSTRLPKPTRKSANEFVNTVDMFLYLAKVYVKLDQPMKALESYQLVRLREWRNKCTVNKNASNANYMYYGHDLMMGGYSSG